METIPRSNFHQRGVPEDIAFKACKYFLENLSCMAGPFVYHCEELWNQLRGTKYEDPNYLEPTTSVEVEGYFNGLGGKYKDAYTSFKFTAETPNPEDNGFSRLCRIKKDDISLEDLAESYDIRISSTSKDAVIDIAASLLGIDPSLVAAQVTQL